MKGFVQVPHDVWEKNLTMDERYMYLYLLDCENRFNKKGEWFNIGNKDLIGIGFGKDTNVLKKARKRLIEKGYIEYHPGGRGKESEYKIKNVD